MSQPASVIIQPASTSKGLPKPSQPGQGQSLNDSTSQFARFLTTAGKSPSQVSSNQSGSAHTDSSPLGQTPSLSEADQAKQVVQALVNVLQEKPQAGQKLQEALEAGDIKASFMGRLLTVLQQSDSGQALDGALQAEGLVTGKGQANGPDREQDGDSMSGLLSALLSQTQLQAQMGSQSLDSGARAELGQLLEHVQTLLGGGKGQVQTAQAEMASQTLDSETRAQLGQLLERVQALLGGGKGQTQDAQSGQVSSQSLDQEARAELRQLLQRMQAMLGQGESKGQAGTGQKAFHVQDGLKPAAPEGLLASQSAATSQPVSPQPAPNRGLGYYLQSYQGAEQAGGKGSTQADLVSASGEGQTSGGSKEGLAGQGRSSLAEAMFLQNSPGGKGQTGTGSGNQFGLTLHNAAETGTGSGGGPAATFSGSQGSAVANPLGGQGASQAFGTQQAFEQSMVDQVRFRMSQGMRSGQQEVVVRMHPRELGEVRLSLTSDDGTLRAHLHVQSQQVQDVLERNMARLRETLAEQGIDVDDFVFSSDEQGQEPEYRTFEQEKWAGGQPSGSGKAMPEGAEVHAGKDQAGFRPEQGLSVRI